MSVAVSVKRIAEMVVCRLLMDLRLMNVYIAKGVIRLMVVALFISHGNFQP